MQHPRRNLNGYRRHSWKEEECCNAGYLRYVRAYPCVSLLARRREDCGFEISVETSIPHLKTRAYIMSTVATTTAPTGSKPAPKKIPADQVPAVFQRYRTELQNLAQKIGELENEMEEHA
jgi:hypothetical protein